ncbi:hypothetical protein Hanom_Chr01g00041861 [Helianthus anomalus]
MVVKEKLQGQPTLSAQTYLYTISRKSYTVSGRRNGKYNKTKQQKTVKTVRALKKMHLFTQML